MPPEPVVLEFSQWVPWKAEECKTLDWWTELSAVPGMEDCRKLAREVWASFWLPQQMQVLGMREANLQAPPIPPCLCRWRFMLPAKSIYACRDIREIPQEKVVAYARALQCWAVEINPPAGGGPCLLQESMKELREEVKWYLSFSDEDVFWGVALHKKEEDQSLKTISTDVPKAPCVPESTTERRSPKFFGWEKVGDLPTIQSLEAKSGTNSAPTDCTSTSKASSLSTKDSHPTQTLLASTGIGTHMATNSTMQLCRSDSLSTDTRASGSGP